MTDRVKAIIITLEEDVRIDNTYLDSLINVLREVKGIANIEMSLTTTDDYINREKIKSEMKKKLYEVLE